MDLVWVFELIFCRNHCSPVCLFCYFLIAYPCLVGFCFADSVVHASRNRKVQTMSRTLWVFRLSIDCLESNISIFTALVTDKKKKVLCNNDHIQSVTPLITLSRLFFGSLKKMNLTLLHTSNYMHRQHRGTEGSNFNTLL